MLKINYTLFIQVANFLFLVFVLNVLLYRPIRHMLRQRKEQMGSFQETRDDFLEKSGQHEKELEVNVVEARKEGFSTKEVLKKDALEVEKGMLQEASASAGVTIDKAKEEIEHSLSDARRSLEGELAQFSRELAEKVLGRSI